MRRGTRILIGAAIAALTFGTLWSTVGPRYNSSWRDGEHDNCGWDNDKNKAAQYNVENISE